MHKIREQPNGDQDTQNGVALSAESLKWLLVPQIGGCTSCDFGRSSLRINSSCCWPSMVTKEAERRPSERSKLFRHRGCDRGCDQGCDQTVSSISRQRRIEFERNFVWDNCWSAYFEIHKFYFIPDNTWKEGRKKSNRPIRLIDSRMKRFPAVYIPHLQCEPLAKFPFSVVFRYYAILYT